MDKQAELSDDACKNIATTLFQKASGNPKLTYSHGCQKIVRSDAVQAVETVTEIFSRHLRAYHRESSKTKPNPFYMDCIINWIESCMRDARRLTPEEVLESFSRYAPAHH